MATPAPAPIFKKSRRLSFIVLQIGGLEWWSNGVMGQQNGSIFITNCSNTPVLQYSIIPFLKRGMPNSRWLLFSLHDNPCTSSSSSLPTALKEVFRFGRYPHGSSCIPFSLGPHDADGRKKRDQAPRRHVSMGSVLSFFRIAWFSLLLDYLWWVLYGTPDRLQCQAIRKRSGSWNSGDTRRTLILALHASYGWKRWAVRFLSLRPDWSRRRETGSRWLIREGKISYDKVIDQKRIIPNTPRLVLDKISLSVQILYEFVKSYLGRCRE